MGTRLCHRPPRMLENIKIIFSTIQIRIWILFVTNGLAIVINLKKYFLLFVVTVTVYAQCTSCTINAHILVLLKESYEKLILCVVENLE